MSEKLQLGENHRRAVSVLLRGLERMCNEIESAERRMVVARGRATL